MRLAKACLTMIAGLFCLLVGYNNIIDYNSNFQFVQHVLSMDTVFPDNAVRASRAIVDPVMHHIGYRIIIASELAIGLLCVFGSFRLFANVSGTAAAFNAAKQLAIAGLAAAVGFWFFAFLVVGGEWFQMWQSQTWNGQESAFRFIGSIGLVLVFLAMED